MLLGFSSANFAVEILNLFLTHNIHGKKGSLCMSPWNFHGNMSAACMPFVATFNVNPNMIRIGQCLTAFRSEAEFRNTVRI